MLLDGLTVLNIIEITEASKFTLNTFAISVIMLLFEWSSVVVWVGTRVERLMNIFTCLTIVVVCITPFIAIYQDRNNKTGDVEYEVTIDESVSMVEFNKRYEIVEQRGDIFVVKEKNNE